MTPPNTGVGDNPYNFQHPVDNPDVFAGRDNERRDIAYYLEQATTTRPTNLAILGSRASGKTSLLNLIARDARDKGLVVVRVNFDEDHARSQLDFFFKLFDSIIHAVVKEKHPSTNTPYFGGRGGTLYQLYLACIASGEQADPTELELVFPNYFARVGQRRDAPVPQSVFSDDLERIAAEVARPIVLLMDECNVIAQNRSILQAMRHMFQNLNTYMLVMTGTDALFPVIDDVYSPVGRGFKRISIRGFESLDETFACMERPLTALGKQPGHADLLFKFRPERETTERGVSDTTNTPSHSDASSRSRSASPDVQYPQSLRDLHEFTGGNPHEIQLACHFMYRSMQERVERWRLHRPLAARLGIPFAAPWLSLSSAVIDKVLAELASDTDRKSRLEQVRGLTLDARAAFGLLSRAGAGHILDTYAALADTEAVLAEEYGAEFPAYRRFNLSAGLQELRHRGWLEVGEGGEVQWLASQLDELFLKYTTREARIPLGTFPRASPLSRYMASLLLSIRIPAVVFTQSWVELWRQSFGSSVAPTVESMLPRDLPRRVLHVLDSSVQIVGLACRVRDGDWQTVCAAVPGGVWDSKEQREADRLAAAMTRASSACEMNGLSWRWVCEPLVNCGPEWGIDNDDWRVPITLPAQVLSPAIQHAFFGRLCDRFLEGKPCIEFVTSLVHQAQLWPEPVLANLGFMMLVYGMPESTAMLERAVAMSPGNALARYNLALSRLLQQNPDCEMIHNELVEIQSLPTSIPDAEPESYARLLQVSAHGSTAVFSEVFPPEPPADWPPLQDYIRVAAGQLQQLWSAGGVSEVVPARREECGAASD